MKFLSPRVLTALVGIPIVLAFVWKGGDVFKGFCAVLAMGALRELQMAVGKSPRYGGAKILGGVAYVAVFFAVWNGLFKFWSAGTLVALLVLAVLFYGTSGQISLASLSVTLFCTLYIALFALLPPLREIGDGRLFLLVLACVWACDTASYYGGRTFGKHKISALSPGKSWEGFVFGLLTSAGVAVAVAYYARAPQWNLPLSEALALGIVLGIAAPLGDLAESFFKRELGVKDLGTLFPGHGGILDRCDSILFAALAATLLAGR